MKKTTKILASIAVLTIILVVAGYFAYDTLFVKKAKQTSQKQEIVQVLPQDETANWPIYTSEKFGFSIKYPEGWQKKEEDETHITFTDPEGSKNILLSYHEESLESVLERGFVGPTRNLREEDITINGKKARRISVQFLLEDIGQGEKWSDEDSIFTYFPNESNNRVVVISSGISNQKIYEKILPTIKVK